jgi:hypothetical protein
MKARFLRELLNDTKYTVSNHDGYIAVGSPMVHNLISVNKKTLKVSYALDSRNKGRESLTKEWNSLGKLELLFIWDKLHELIESGEIKDIIEGKDIIENPLPVFTVKDGQLVESKTDAYGWPNTDDDGRMLYNNTHFPTSIQAIEYGIEEEEEDRKLRHKRFGELETQLQEQIQGIKTAESNIAYLKALKDAILLKKKLQARIIPTQG